MNDHQLAAGLRTSSPDALPDLLDAYGDRLFSYCWWLLRNRESAQVAVRDALIAAAAHAGRLVRDEWLGPWLYCLARAECGLRAAVPAGDADEPAVWLHRQDGDSRQMAWNAVTSLDAAEAEVLELSCRHEVDICLVIGLPPADVEVLLDQAQHHLERALGAEILIRKSHACPVRAEVLTGWSGVTTPAIRDRMLEHAPDCLACAPHRPRGVSAAKVFAQLPAPELSSLARLEILGFFEDPRMSAYREFAASRATEITGSAFLIDPDFVAGSGLAKEPGTPEPSLAPVPPAAMAGPESEPAAPEAAKPEPAGSRPMPIPMPMPEPGPSSTGSRPQPAHPGLPARSRPAVAQGFMGSWEPTGSAPASGPRPRSAPTLPPASPARHAAVPGRQASIPAQRTALHSGPSLSPGRPAHPVAPSAFSPAHPAGPITPSPAGRPAARPQAGQPQAAAPWPPVAPPEQLTALPGHVAPRPRPSVPAGPGRAASAPAGPVFPAPATGTLAELVAPPADPADKTSLRTPSVANTSIDKPSVTKTSVAPAGAGPAAPPPAAAPENPRRHGKRRLRLKGLLTGVVAAATVSAAIAVVGLHDVPAARSGHAGSAGTQPGSSVASSGGADVAAPVEVSRSAGPRSSTVPFRDTAATRPESLAVTATKRDDSSQPGRPAQSGGLEVPAAAGSAGAAPSPSPSASTAAPAADGTLSVTPGPVNLGTQATGQITLAASGGPVSWSATTSTGRLALTGSQGTLQAGQSVTLTVTRHNGSGGSGYVVIDWNPVSPVAAAEPDASPVTSQAVQVSWSGIGTASPSPSPSTSGSGGTSPSESDSSSPQFGSQ